MNSRIEWNDAKNLLNQAKHGISFKEASQLLLSDEIQLEIFDADHSDNEERLMTVGPVNGKLILVVWTEREEDVVRIISARKASRKEIFLYYKFKSEQ